MQRWQRWAGRVIVVLAVFQASFCGAWGADSDITGEVDAGRFKDFVTTVLCLKPPQQPALT